MRRFLTAITMAVATVAAGTAVVGAPAPVGAQSLTCTFTVTPNELANAGKVAVSGVAPGSTKVEVRVDGVTAATAQSAPVSGIWGPVSVEVTSTSTISIALPDNYATLPCIGNGGTEVVKVSVGASVGLPRTGSDSSHTALVALAAIGVGLVLVVGARRRRSVRPRV